MFAQHALQLVASDPIQPYPWIILVSGAAQAAGKQKDAARLQAIDGADLPASNQAVQEAIAGGPPATGTERQFIDAVCLEDVAQIPKRGALVVPLVAQRGERVKAGGAIRGIECQWFREGVVSGASK